ncbi:hypothetical protein HF086_017422 [Spodoptera exigua]|uniref:Uncharacterized protein n=1 Tax=Spodoptera exigua TaxID=7107 RepID=A0A922MBI1_SPOEX|nr:hypothetical protein HF086_017422 [Spodoptera exigua]
MSIAHVVRSGPAQVERVPGGVGAAVRAAGAGRRLARARRAPPRRGPRRAARPARAPAGRAARRAGGARGGAGRGARAARPVLAGCAPPLAQHVHDQLHLLADRAHALTAALHLMEIEENNMQTNSDVLTRNNAEDSTQDNKQDDTLTKTQDSTQDATQWSAGARAALRHVEELLAGTRANPADRTCLAVRHSLVKVPLHSYLATYRITWLLKK